MPEKLIAAMIAVIAGLLLGSTMMASAQTKAQRQNAPIYMRDVAPNRGMQWRDLTPGPIGKASCRTAATIGPIPTPALIYTA